VPPELPVISSTEPARRLPSWLRRQVPKGNANHFTAGLIDDLGLETVCDHAQCPNRMECYSRKTATFMILGDTCTRPCRFCAVARGKTRPVDPDEPRRVALAAQRMGLKHVVITSVTRDDLPDGGAQHFCDCIREVRQLTGAAVEVLTPDFLHDHAAVQLLADAEPEVFGHNTETVPRLYRVMRGPKSDYRWTLELLRTIKQHNPRIHTKTGIMLGVGETRAELLDVFADLLDHGCEFLTLGQYLQPSRDQCLPVERYLHPDEFTELGKIARQMGFRRVASGPFVRSSYHAREMVTDQA
jgi:lipoic acid synthetase